MHGLHSLFLQESSLGMSSSLSNAKPLRCCCKERGDGNRLPVNAGELL